MLTKLTTSLFAKTQPEREVHEDEHEHEHEHELPCYPVLPRARHRLERSTLRPQTAIQERIAFTRAQSDAAPPTQSSLKPR